jgi:hypothetical protein
MRGGIDSLENLFGFDRHKFPKSIHSIRRHKTVFYNLRSVMQCMIFFLDDKLSDGRWLLDPSRRQLVLMGVIKRAEDVGSKEIAESVRQILQPYLT